MDRELGSFPPIRACQGPREQSHGVRQFGHSVPSRVAMSADPGASGLTRLSLDQTAAVLHRAGARHMDAQRVKADIAAGAPANPDGTINLIAYGAWMLQELARREGHRDA